MKRLLLAACLAIGVHVVIFSLQPKWITPTREMRQNRSVTISLLDAPPAPQKTALPRPVEEVRPKPIPKPKLKPKPRPAKTPVPAVADQPAPDPTPLPETAVATEPAQPQETALPDEVPTDQPPGSQASAAIQSAVPRHNANPPPHYPRVAKRRGYQGTVVLEVLVTREGRAGKVRVFQSSGYPILDRRAVETVQKWSYAPGLRGSEPVEMWVKQPITFQLK